VLLLVVLLPEDSEEVDRLFTPLSLEELFFVLLLLGLPLSLFPESLVERADVPEERFDLPERVELFRFDEDPVRDFPVSPDCVSLLIWRSRTLLSSFDPALSRLVPPRRLFVLVPRS
jgi:hypothetical protein